jgi:hypothetical protein
MPRLQHTSKDFIADRNKNTPINSLRIMLPIDINKPALRLLSVKVIDATGANAMPVVVTVLGVVHLTLACSDSDDFPACRFSKSSSVNSAIPSTVRAKRAVPVWFGLSCDLI